MVKCLINLGREQVGVMSSNFLTSAEMHINTYRRLTRPMELTLMAKMSLIEMIYNLLGDEASFLFIANTDLNSDAHKNKFTFCPWFTFHLSQHRIIISNHKTVSF